MLGSPMSLVSTLAALGACLVLVTVVGWWVALRVQRRYAAREREMRARLLRSARLAAVGELVAGVAHEVNNPLGSISAFAQILLRDEALTAAQRDSVDVINAEALRASQIVKDLLAFARNSDPVRAPLDVNSVIQSALRLHGYELSSNRIGVELALAARLPTVLGDARQLQQVCLNVISNAIQAMSPGGSGTLFVSTRVSGSRVIVELGDTGPGIPDHAAARVFEPFFTTKDDGKGTGLGLSVSRGIIEAHGGTIEVASTSASGTIFRLSLPAAASADLDAAQGAAGVAQPASGASNVSER